MSTTKLKKYNVSEQFFLNWECEASSAEEARQMYEVYISDTVQREQLVSEALENKWDVDVNVEEVSE